MRHLFILFFLAMLSFPFHELKAQDPQFSQFYAAPLYLNPAFAGTAPSARVGTIFRDQWPGIPQATFITSSSYFDYFFDKYNSGLGAVITVDRQGNLGPVTTNLTIDYSYQVLLSQKLTFRPGIGVGLATQHISTNGLFGPDGDITGLDKSNRIYPDLSLGGILYSPKFWAGISVFHINQPNQSFFDPSPANTDTTNSRLPVKYSIHGGYKFPLYMPGSNRPGYNIYGKERSFTPAFVYKRQRNFSSLELGIYTTLEPLVVGLWYRGTPGGLNREESIEDQFLKSDAVIFLVGFTNDNFKIGYSYDLTISKLDASSGGAHEISFTYEFQLGKKLPPRNVREIPCPSF